MRFLTFALWLIAGAAGLPSLAAQPWVTATENNLFRISIGPGLHARYYVSHRLDQPAPSLKRVVINLPGGQRNAVRSFGAVAQGAQIAGVAAECAIVAFAPKVEADPREPGEVFWDDNDHWKIGEQSTAKLPHRASSFALVDRLLVELGDRRRFPHLAMIVLTGHSSGGQFAQRYAVASAAPDALSPGVRMRFVPANPSSYFYFRPERVKPGMRYEFWIPPSDVAVTKYHSYKHGPVGAPAYFAGAHWEGLATRYRQRDVVMLQGTMDIDTTHSGLDKSPGDLAQGPNRLERSRHYLAYLHAFHAPHNHVLLEVPMVGHEGDRMFTSAAGIRALFDVTADIRKVSDGVPAKPGGRPD